MPRLAFLAAALALAACTAAAPTTTTELAARPIAQGHGRLYVIRAHQAGYSALPLQVSVNGETVGPLADGSYLATELPAGASTLTVAAVLSRSSASFDLPPGATAYAAVSLAPVGSPPPRSAVGAAPAYPMAAEQSLFSIRFVDPAAAQGLLAQLKPAG